MIDFLRPGTRVYVGQDYEIPAVITALSIRCLSEPVYSVEWFVEGCLQSVCLNRCQFALEQGAPDRDHAPIEVNQDAL